jgi:type VI secretion system protein ImpK
MPPTAPAGRLAASLQEVLTIGVRLRGDRQAVPDGAAFRGHVRQLLAAAQQDALAAGCPAADVQAAQFAAVAFLDETILNGRLPALADWARRPLQEELFGGHMAGEWFFTQLDQLLARPDTAELMELFEVYQLCLLLGFRGRYSTAGHGPLQALTARVGERLARGRGAEGELAPGWRPPADALDLRDPLARPLLGAVVALAVAVVLLWGGATLLLHKEVGEVRAAASAVSAAAAPASR